jgi:hypothetical protein
MSIIFPDYLNYLNFALCFSVFLFFACFHVYASLARFNYTFLRLKVYLNLIRRILTELVTIRMTTPIQTTSPMEFLGPML